MKNTVAYVNLITLSFAMIYCAITVQTEANDYVGTLVPEARLSGSDK